VLKVAVPSADTGELELEGGNVCPTDYLVVCVHFATKSMSLGVFDLDLQEVFWRTIDLVETLRTGGLDWSLHSSGAVGGWWALA